ncbi:MAG: flagellar basal body rod protein FlgB [Proteobacteria bacterium]|nr:flagellar basal body rod protein FlgB [Pseudomonadota bacterium]HQR05111.1 flagellar basal body rod protein FlgB [Rhodocyclaceae bacterium]
MSDRVDQHFRVIQAALGLRNYRQELLASNIANADTPNYKARDIDFRAALGDALAGRRAGSLDLARTSTEHLRGGGGNRFGALTAYRQDYQGGVDGNAVNMDVERAAMAENTIRMEALLTFIRGDFKDMQTAITSN